MELIKEISIHAPSRERPGQSGNSSTDKSDFNPRSLTGATLFGEGFDVPDCISIHAPSRERRGRCILFGGRKPFQSTLPHGSDRDMRPHLCRDLLHFNPRSLTGATGLTLRAGLFTSISIHAPSRERQHVGGTCPHWSGISIHAPSRERPECPLKRIYEYIISIHAPSRERRYLIIHLLNGIELFQSTLPHGSDCIYYTKRDYYAHFNPRSLTGATQH